LGRTRSPAPTLFARPSRTTPSIVGGCANGRRTPAWPPLPAYELLELYLTRSIPRRDVKPLAKALLARFGSLAGVLAATPAELCRIDGVGESVALDLCLLHEATLRVSRGEVAKRTVITAWSQLLAYVRVAQAHEPREQFRVVFLDRKWSIPEIASPWPRRHALRIKSG
jgi:DNA repair protein RadC